MCWTIFSRQTYGKSNEYFGAFVTNTTSQRLSIQNVTPAAIIWRQFEGEFLRSPLLGVRGVLGGRELYNRKPTHDFPLPLSTNVSSIFRRLAGILMSNYALISAPRLGVRVNLGGGVENGTNGNVEPHSYSTSIYIIGLSCTVWPQCTTWQTTGQTTGHSDRNRLPASAVVTMAARTQQKPRSELLKGIL